MKYLNNAFKQPFAPIIWKPVNGKEIYEISKKLKWKKSFGYDGVPGWIVKLSIPYIISPLIFIINRMLSSGVFPSRLKFSQISPIFKKGKKTEISAYRPVSLLTSFSKIFERVIYNRLIQHAQVNNIITKDQYGFKENSSTELAIFKLTNQILTCINNKDAVCGIFCDVSKAFDTLNHEILISKLKYYGVTGIAGDLIKSYLSNRFQRVRIRTSQFANSTSRWRLVKYGVPQGSILGPLIFILYTNDLPYMVKNNVLPVMFADDASFIVSNPNLKDMTYNVGVVLNRIQKWYRANILLLNKDKTAIIHFPSGIACRSMDNTNSTSDKTYPTDSLKFLGVTIESSLTWGKHTDLITSKLNSLGYMIRSLRPVLTVNVIKQIYFSYIHSILSYNIIFWGSAPSSKTVFIVQKRIVRLIMNARTNEPCRNIFRRLGILTLYSQYILSVIMFVAKNRQIFASNESIHNFGTRRKLDLHVPSVRLTKNKKGVYYSGTVLFNALPIHIKKVAHNVKKLKQELKRFLLEKSFYSVNEYLHYEMQ
jgi:hypothetical protein